MSQFKDSVVDKAYELKEASYRLDVDDDKRKEFLNKMDVTLRICLCNKFVKGRYCKHKKSGKYCTFHNNMKAKFDNKLTNILVKVMSKDVAGLVISYLDF